MTAAAIVDVELFDQTGKPIMLSSTWQDRTAVLVFYPGDFTRVCTAQLCDYRNRWADFAASNATVIGINPGTWQKHAQFVKAHDFPFPILSDPNGDCCRNFLAKAWWGTRRMVVVVDRQGVERWRKSVMPYSRQSADEVLTAVRESVHPAPPAPQG
jgi:peroxiredoxin Q/BCP